MKKTLTTLALLIAVAVPAASQAAPMRPGPYVTGFLGITVPRSTDSSTTDFFNNTTSDERIEFDPGIYVGGAGGYDFGFMRLEGELSYKQADIKSITDNAGGGQFRNIDGSLGALAFMANAFFDIHNDTPVTPYLGGGIGFASLYMTDTFATSGTSRLHMYPQDNDTVFAYQVGAGLGIALNRRYSLDLGYRYFNTDRASFNGDLLTTSGIRFESHNAMVGFRAKF